jgi:negative regulator of sigma E activity
MPQWAAGQVVPDSIAALRSGEPSDQEDIVAPVVPQMSSSRMEWGVLKEWLRPAVSVGVVAMILTAVAVLVVFEKRRW